jgi:hypothetical protein
MMGDAALKQPPFLKINPAGGACRLAPASLEEEARTWQWSSWR